MSKKAFDKIAQGLSEAIAITKGEMKPANFTFPTRSTSEACAGASA